MDNKGMKKFFLLMTLLSAFSLSIAFLWEKIPAIKNTAHLILDPTAGALINWNLTAGTLILFFIISVITTVVQKYATDQKTLRELKEEQKKVQKEMQEFKDNPEKTMEINKRSMKIMGDIMSLGMKSNVITVIPLILLFKWFSDVFTALGNPKFFGFMGWFVLYLFSLIIFSGFLRKWMKVA
jgi:uncharacterized membrane protein (DUF106 family)